MALKNYITPSGMKRLKDEALNLLDVERPELVKVIHWAASNGDRSENGDYIYGKKRRREIDSRVRFLQKRLDELTVVDTTPADMHKVYFGGWVRLEDDAGVSHEYRLVGPDEFDVRSGLLSCDSPLGKALLGKAPGDTVVVNNPEGSREWFVHSVSYA